MNPEQKNELFGAGEKGKSDRSGYVIRAVDVKKVYRMGDSETHALRCCNGQEL